MSAAHAASIVVVLSESGHVHQEFAQTFSNQVLRSQPGMQISVIEVAQLAANALSEASLVVGVGSRAAAALLALESTPPLLLSMLPRESFERLRGQRTRVGAVFIDQPPARYISLIRLALPELERVGMLSSRDSQDGVARLMQAAREQHLRGHNELIADESEIMPALQKLFPGGGVLLATPDSSIFNAHTLPGILLGAFRRKVPVIGFSAAYVSAGAVLSLYSSPEQLASQCADIARNLLNGSTALPAQYPRQFSIGINDRVARSLGLNLDSSTALRERLEKLERQP
ncbi:ABC transporter substrate-binding protein [Uliginosibacterium sp. 31-12]|uniref:ABC transporter substrate-binding protein n=1 Tax=Uliginosibacterium sp. 31-12 TaxID=3062781 RepID=UPI0026E35915|nr:ABC transporter substrate binding protein [Uliginosibacterium sp. 31-12]MDO6388095.1 ABC transporter substrate binding protein [Uliginosibacterium sp. 31-12]